jgi:hypothetical protein
MDKERRIHRETRRDGYTDGQGEQDTQIDKERRIHRWTRRDGYTDGQ